MNNSLGRTFLVGLAFFAGLILMLFLFFFLVDSAFAKEFPRDDVQKFIDLKYPDSELIRTMLAVYAQGIQAMIVDANDEALSIKHQDDAMMLGNCANHIIWKKKIKLWKWMDMEKEIRGKVINTPERKNKFKLSNNQGGMRTFTGDVPSGPEDAKKFCPFDPDLLPD